MKKPRIISYSDSEHSPCSFYRSIGPLSELARRDLIEHEEGFYGNDDWTILRKFDIAFFQRPMSKECLSQVAVCADLGLKVVVDLDDHGTAISPSHPVYNTWCHHYDEKTFEKVMELADLVLTSTKRLQQHYLTYNNNVLVIPNAYNDYWIPLHRWSPNKLVVIRGGNHHLQDIWHYRNEIIDVMNEYPDWKLEVLGGEVKFFENKMPNYHWRENLIVHEYFGYISTFKPGIILVPLEPNELNYSKSNISWQEATIGGGVTLTPSYFDLSGQSCIYRGNKSFKTGFEKLLSNDSYRKKLHDASVQHLKENYLLSEVNKKRLEIFNQLI